MNKTLLLSAIIGLVVFTSCDDEHEHFKPFHGKEINVTTQIDNLTRVSANADGSQKFDTNDQISVYAWTGDATVIPAAADRVVDNAINTYNGYKWVAQPQMLWKDNVTPHYFIGIYPHTDSSISDFTSLPYTLDSSNQTASDLLIATNTTGLVNTGNSVPLLFQHVMSRVVLNFNFRTQFEGHPNVQKVVLKDAICNATVNCLTSAVTLGTNKADISIPATTTAGQYASVVIPQSGIRTIVITIDNKDYTYTHTEDISVQHGKNTTINLNVGKDEITLASVDINDWQKGTEINGGEAQ